MPAHCIWRTLDNLVRRRGESKESALRVTLLRNPSLHAAHCVFSCLVTSFAIDSEIVTF